jgi:phage tail-like protein
MATTTSYYPNVNFAFLVHFYPPSPATATDVGFQSVTGLDATIQTESINEGGVNHYSHQVPTRRKYGPVVLKRGLLGPDKSGLTTYIKSCFDNETFAPMKTMVIQLLDEQNNPMLQWRATNVWPLSWKVGELNAMQGEVLIETLELNINQLIFEKP